MTIYRTNKYFNDPLAKKKKKNKKTKTSIKKRKLLQRFYSE